MLICGVVRSASADFEHLGFQIGAVLQAMAVAITCLKSGCIARAQDFFAAISNRAPLPRQHVYTLVLFGVPMTLARSRSRL
jgi:hypothetical protein